MIDLAMLLACLALIAGAESIATFVDPVWGTIAYLFLMALLIVQSTAVRMNPGHRLYLALGLVPLIRIVSLTMPVSDMSPAYSHLVLAIPIIVGVIAVMVALKIWPSQIGIRVRGIRLQAMVAVCGMGIGLVDYLILRPEPWIPALTWRDVVIPALILLVAAGFLEELLFRGVLQRTAESVGSWGWIYVAAVSSVLQMGHRSATHWLLALGVAIFFGWIVKRTGSILGVSLSHGIAVICLYLVFPFVF